MYPIVFLWELKVELLYQFDNLFYILQDKKFKALKKKIQILTIEVACNVHSTKFGWNGFNISEEKESGDQRRKMAFMKIIQQEDRKY